MEVYGKSKCFLVKTWNLSPLRDTVVTECPWIDKEQYAFASDAAAETAIALADAESEIEHCLLPFPIQSIRERAREGPRPKLFFVSKATQILKHKVA